MFRLLYLWASAFGTKAEVTVAALKRPRHVKTKFGFWQGLTGLVHRPRISFYLHWQRESTLGFQHLADKRCAYPVTAIRRINYSRT